MRPRLLAAHNRSPRLPSWTKSGLPLMPWIDAPNFFSFEMLWDVAESRKSDASFDVSSVSSDVSDFLVRGDVTSDEEIGACCHNITGGVEKSGDVFPKQKFTTTPLVIIWWCRVWHEAELGRFCAGGVACGQSTLWTVRGDAAIHCRADLPRLRGAHHRRTHSRLHA